MTIGNRNTDERNEKLRISGHLQVQSGKQYFHRSRSTRLKQLTRLNLIHGIHCLHLTANQLLTRADPLNHAKSAILTDFTGEQGVLTGGR